MGTFWGIPQGRSDDFGESFIALNSVRLSGGTSLQVPAQIRESAERWVVYKIRLI